VITIAVIFRSGVTGSGILSRIPHVVINGDPDKRYIGNLNISFAYVEGESLLMVSSVKMAYNG
jgi:cysteine sulfinate desulfinase/cysteine desulfurase-like protein